MIKEMKKGVFGLMHWIRDIEEMKKSLEIADENKVKFHGIKFHPRLFPEKEKQTVLLSDMVDKKVLEFAESEKLAMILELSHGFCKEDVSLLKEIDSSYKINVIIPHMGYNYKGFVMNADEFKKNLTGKTDEFEKEFKKISDSKRIFMDSALVVDKRIVEAGLKVFGQEKIMYGTDFPFCFTPKIEENRGDNEELVNILRCIIDGRCEEVKEIWRYDYNIYLIVKAIIEAQNSLNLDVSNNVMYKNAKNVFRLSL
jgi:predicted TIM-barrel fold metal-dependent hydrolase